MRAAAVVLAAGRGERFGTATKQLAQVDGRSLVRHAVDAAIAAQLDEVVVVLGHDAAAVAAQLPDEARVRAVTNPRFGEGQSTSVVAGIEALDDDVDVVVFLLGDQPGLPPDAIRAVIGAVRGGALVARAVYDDGPSHPVAFARDTWPALRELRGDEGARQVLHRFTVEPVRVPGPAPRDIDRPDDL